MAAGSFVKDWLPAILGGVVGAADPQTGDALTQTITMAQAAKKRRLDEQRQAQLMEQQNQRFTWAAEDHAWTDRQRRDATSDKMRLEQMLGKFDFTDWTPDAIAAANAADTPEEFMRIVDTVAGRGYRAAAEGRAEAGEGRAAETYEYGKGRRPVKERAEDLSVQGAEQGIRLRESAEGRAAESYGYDVSQRPVTEALRVQPVLSNFLMSGSQIPAAQGAVDRAKREAEIPVEDKTKLIGTTGEKEQSQANQAIREQRAAVEGEGKIADAEAQLQKLEQQYNVTRAQLEILSQQPQYEWLKQLLDDAGSGGSGPEGVSVNPDTQAKIDALVNARISPEE